MVVLELRAPSASIQANKAEAALPSLIWLCKSHSHFHWIPLVKLLGFEGTQTLPLRKKCQRVSNYCFKNTTIRFLSLLHIILKIDQGQKETPQKKSQQTAQTSTSLIIRKIWTIPSYHFSPTRLTKIKRAGMLLAGGAVGKQPPRARPGRRCNESTLPAGDYWALWFSRPASGNP